MTGTESTSTRVKVGFAALGVVVLLLMGWIVNLQLQMSRIQTVSERADHRAQTSLSFHSRARRAANGISKEGAPGGATFVRWGRSDCPKTGTERVYEGVMGGKWYGHHGSGGNYLCMPRRPEWLRTKAGVQGGGSVYGVEYETNLGQREDLFFHTGAKRMQDHDAVCAVCRSYYHTSQVMIPGKVNCEKGWTRQYFGYLMTERAAHAAEKDFICVDHAPQADAGGHKNENGGLLYFVEAMCGSLPCPHYINGNEIPCVVCSK